MSCDKKEEHVLVIPKTAFESAGYFEGFRDYDRQFRERLLSPADLSFQPRSQMEIDPNFKQLIPYVVLKYQNLIFEYVRGSSGGEKRLHAKRSIGIGGHISSTDAESDGDVYGTGMRRELVEEVAMPAEWVDQPIGFIFDPSTPVGEVHLGIVHLVELSTPNVQAREESIAQGKFSTVEELTARLSEFETWSQLALQAIQKKKSRT